MKSKNSTEPKKLKRPPFTTDTELRGPKLPGLYSDAGGDPKDRGLYLKVSPQGGKAFVFRYRDRGTGKQRYMGLGPYGKNNVTLDAARTKAAECREQLRKGIDPIAERERLKAELLASQGKIPTFSECSAKYIAAHSPSWKNVKHTAQWKSTLKTYADPIIGKLPVSMIDTHHVLKILEPIWTTKTETAKRLQGRMEKVIDFATARKYRSGENPARWRGHLDTMLAKPTKVKKVQHHKSLPYTELYEFITELKQLQGVSARALEFTILTAARTGEVIAAEWSEFDLQANVWTVPASRMKAGREHRVPLSNAAVDVLKAQQGLDARYVFPGVREGKHMSNMAMLELVRGMNRTFTVHGFRSSFRNWCAERTSFRSEVAEAALAHTNANKVEAAYKHTDHLEERVSMMKRWADHCLTKQTAKVAQLAVA